MPDHPPRWPPGSRLAEFENAERLRAAAVALFARGQRSIEYHAPVPLNDLDEMLAPARSTLPRLVLAGGVLGAIGSYAVQWYANVVDYPIDIGGRPVHAIPAFLVATFEGTVLVAALAAFFGFFLGAHPRLPRLWHPVFEADGFERATVDRFWLVVAADQAWPDLLTPELERLGAIRTFPLEGGS